MGVVVWMVNRTKLLRIGILLLVAGVSSWATGYYTCLRNDGIPLSAYDCVEFGNAICTYKNDMLLIRPNRTPQVIRIPLITEAGI